MTPETMSEALNAIHQVAESALSEEMPPSAKDKLTLIMSIARYGFDVRGAGERSQEPGTKG